MSVTTPTRRRDSSRARLPGQPPRGQAQREGLGLLVAIVAVMWVIEAINSLDGNSLSNDGIYARNIDRFWGILTAPFIHASFTHLLDNTIPFVFLGAIIALRGALRLAIVTGFVIVIGGLGTWLISPAGSALHPIDTIGASGVVFGYATYLMSRGFFDRSGLELAVGVIVGVIWGGALLASLVPQPHISWQAHACGAVAGVIVAWRLSAYDRRRRRAPRPAAAGTTAI